MSEMELASGVERAARRAKWVIVLLAACVLADVTALAAGWMQLNLLGRVAAGEEISDAEAEGNDSLYGTVGYTQLSLFIATATVWLLWLYWAYYNVTRGGKRLARFTPGWAVGWWFIPFMNLWRPYQIVTDLSLRSQDPELNPPEGSKDGLVAAWWGSWLLAGITGRLASRFARGADDIESLISLTRWTMLADVLTAAAGLLAIAVVRRITRAQLAWPDQPPAASETAVPDPPRAKATSLRQISPADLLVIDLSRVTTAGELHFPEYYGHNWDAFWDCIKDPEQSLMPPRLRIVGWNHLAARLPREAALLRECLENLPEERPECRVEWSD
jgi:RNAse (barnase) inhibitor barstar